MAMVSCGSVLAETTLGTHRERRTAARLDRIHGLSLLCKHWSSIALQGDMPNNHQFPWLLVTKAPRLLGGTNPRPKYLELSIPPDGNVITLGLSKQNQGLFHSSCKDWLIMDNEENSGSISTKPYF